MPFVDNLKDIVHKKEVSQEKGYIMDDDIATQIRNDPQYDKVIAKLRILEDERNILLRRLQKIDLDIDTCLVIISIGKEREAFKNG